MVPLNCTPNLSIPSVKPLYNCIAILQHWCRNTLACQPHRMETNANVFSHKVFTRDGESAMWSSESTTTSQFLYWMIRGAFFAWRAPIVSWPRIICSQVRKIFRTVTRNAVNKSIWRKKDCSWLPLNKHAMDIWLNSLRNRAHLS